MVSFLFAQNFLFSMWSLCTSFVGSDLYYVYWL